MSWGGQDNVVKLCARGYAGLRTRPTGSPTMRQPLKHLALLALFAVALPLGAAAWPPGGVVVAPVPDRGQGEPHVLLGRAGSVLAFWSDGRWLDSFDVYGQLLTHDGLI